MSNTTKNTIDEIEKQKIGVLFYLKRQLFKNPSLPERLSYNASRKDDVSFILPFIHEANQQPEEGQLNYFLCKKEEIMNTFRKNLQINVQEEDFITLAGILCFCTRGLQNFEDSGVDRTVVDSSWDQRRRERDILYTLILRLDCTEQEKDKLISILRAGRDWFIGDANDQIVKPPVEFVEKMSEFAEKLTYPEKAEADGYKPEQVKQFFNELTVSLAALQKTDTAAYEAISSRLAGDFPTLEFVQKVQEQGTPEGDISSGFSVRTHNTKKLR